MSIRAFTRNMFNHLTRKAIEKFHNITGSKFRPKPAVDVVKEDQFLGTVIEKLRDETSLTQLRQGQVPLEYRFVRPRGLHATDYPLHDSTRANLDPSFLDLEILTLNPEAVARHITIRKAAMPSHTAQGIEEAGQKELAKLHSKLLVKADANTPEEIDAAIRLHLGQPGTRGDWIKQTASQSLTRTKQKEYEVHVAGLVREHRQKNLVSERKPTASDQKLLEYTSSHHLNARLYRLLRYLSTIHTQERTHAINYTVRLASALMENLNAKPPEIHEIRPGTITKIHALLTAKTAQELETLKK